MIKLKKIELQAFRSFKDHTVLEFPDNGLYLISGLNKDTGGSSNSGKSSLNLAISYALGYCPFSATSLQCYLTDKKMQVTLYFAIDDIPVIVGRGKETFIDINGVVHNGATAVNDKIKALFGLNDDFLRALTYRPQNTQSFFLSMNDSQKKEFLSALLELEDLESSIDTSVANLKKYETQLAPLFSIKQRYEDKLIFVKTEYSKLKFVDESLLVKSVKIHEENLQNYKQSLANLQTQADNCQILINQISVDPTLSPTGTEIILDNLFISDEINKLQKDKIKFNESTNMQIQLLRYARSKHLDDINNFVLKSNIKEDIRLISNLDSQIGGLNNKRCPTCKQDWDSQEILESLMQEKRSVEGLIKQEQDAVAKHTEKLENLILEIDNNIANIEKELIAYNSQYDIKYTELSTKYTEVVEQSQILQNQRIKIRQEYEEKLNNKLKVHLFNLKDIQTNINNIKINIDKEFYTLAQAQQEYKSAQLQNSQVKAELNSRNLEIIEINDNIIKNQDLISQLETSIQSEQKYQELITEFLGKIFDEILQEISIESSEILKHIPNTSKITVRFDSEKSTLKGTKNLNITAIISKSGVDLPLKSGLSGGMLSAVELAIDFAISNVVTRRTSKNIGWLVLDEAFNGLGVVEKEACGEILRQQAQNKLVLVVDHSTEFAGLFDGTINIVMQDDISTLT